MTNQWNATTYDSAHSYVWTLAADLIDLLAPQPNERILDLGCGTGHLTAQIAPRGATVIGLDASAEMIEQARQNYPEIDFRVGDATNFQFSEKFDAVFSNATLHWVKNAQAAADCIFHALKPGGRFVAEFGGHQNVHTIMQSISHALKSVGAPTFESLSPWFYPTIGQYSTTLEKAGFEVTFARLFDRPTLIEAGLRSWLEQYGTTFIKAIGPSRRETFLTKVEESARPKLFKDDKWIADYRRLRIVAISANMMP